MEAAVAVERNANSQSASRNDEIMGDGVGWSGRELDEIPVVRRRKANSAFADVPDDGTRKAAMIFGMIIVGFAGVGISLAQFSPQRQTIGFPACVQMAKNAERLACYDKAAAAAEAPFKGGSPFSTFSRSDPETGGQG
jgi:hypothetical protein